MSQELLFVLVGGPGIVGLIIAIIGFLQNKRTLRATQPKTDAEKMGVDIANLRALLQEAREARKADRSDFDYRVAELRAQLKEQERRCNERVDDILHRFEAYLQEHAIQKPHWWPSRHHPDKGLD